MVPLQSSLTITLPVGHGCQPDHNPFPGFQPFIDKFDDKVGNLSNYMYATVWKAMYNSICTLPLGRNIVIAAEA